MLVGEYEFALCCVTYLRCYLKFLSLFALCDVLCLHNEQITRKFFSLRSILPHSVQVWIGIEMKGEEEKWWFCTNFARNQTRNRWTEHDTKQKLRSDKEWNYSNYDVKKGIGTMSNNAEANFSAHTTIIFFSSFSLCVGSFGAESVRWHTMAENRWLNVC